MGRVSRPPPEIPNYSLPPVPCQMCAILPQHRVVEQAEDSWVLEGEAPLSVLMTSPSVLWWDFFSDAAVLGGGHPLFCK